MPIAFLRRPDPDHFTVPHGGGTVRVLLRRRPAARRLILRVSHATGEAVLTVPSRTSVATARQFAEAHAGWIAVRLAKVPDRIAFEPGAAVPFRGAAHTIAHRGIRSGVTLAQSDGNGNTLSVSCEPEHVARRVRDFLQREARTDLARCVETYSVALGRSPRRITLRDTRSRWGSCTAAGELNFSWRLIMAPPVVLDYLVAHEMAHLREMNHSQRFWRLVGDLCPNVDEAEAWLKRNGSSLHRYG